MPKLPHRCGALLAAALATAPAHAEPLVAEFMASNSEAHADGDGNFPDWIEIHNPDATAADLGGWGLRDSAETWLFPAGTSIPAGGYLVVFASGQASSNYVDAGGHLHTTFKLSADGEPLALLRPDSSVAFEYTTVPGQHEDVSYGLLAAQETLVEPDSAARHWVPDASLTADWIQKIYDDSAWTAGKAAVGFKTTPGPVLGGGGGVYTSYLVEAGTPGNQQYGGALGMDFEVLEEVRVSDLGVFDADSDGLGRTITAQLWSRVGGAGGSVLASETFTPGDPGTLEGGSRFKPLAAPLVLAPGSYTMVAYGYGSGEPNANQGGGSLNGLDIDTGGGLLQFVGDSRFGTAGSFPTTVDGGPSNRYGAGTFKFSPNTAGDIETDVESAMWNSNSSALLRAPFDVADPADVDTLLLEVGFDDGFVAWVNGVEIARHNAPGALAYDSAATAEGNAAMSFPAALPPGTLTATGNVLAIQGLNLSAADGDFIVSPRLTGIGFELASARFFTSPTPGAPNDPAGVIGFVADTVFSAHRGFYDAPFDVSIITATPGATIRYTTDGSEPTETNGQNYTESITITETTVLRAAAFKADHEPTNVDTQSYLFLDEVAVRDNSPPGYPSSWGAIGADYAMDQDAADYARAAGDAGFTPAEARNAIVDSLEAIPTLSIATDMDNLFHPSTGIYTNPSGRGASWERPVSVELIDGSGIGQFQVDAGLRIMGFTSRNLNFTPKLNMRLLFKKEYGAGQLDYPFLGPDGPGKFNTLALRGNTRDSFIFGSQSYIEDEWAKRAQFALGQPAARGTFVHVYLNGIYWGIYNPTERPDDAFAETYLGGDKSEYDVVKFCCPDRHIAGSIDKWDELLAESRAGLGDTASYQRILGNNPDGSPNPAFPVLIDIDNFIDYVINGQYHASGDWPGNYYVIRDRVEGRSTGFKYFTWDNDLALATGGNKVNPSPGHNWWTESPGEMDIALRANADYRMRFADRVYKHYFHGGAMTEAENVARWNELADLIRPALFAESARWGDAKQSLRTVQDHWAPVHSAKVSSYFPTRQAAVFSQMRAHDLYADLDPPAFNQHGGSVESGFDLQFTAAATVYYTTDGSDPRMPGGGINGTAASGASLELMETSRLRARAFDGSEWSALNEATFIVGVTPDASKLAVSEIMYHPSGADTAGEYIELVNLSETDTLDLTDVYFSDGITFAFPLGFTLAPGGRAVLVADPAGFAAAYPAVPIAGTFTGAFENSGERIAITDAFGSEFLAFEYDDNYPWPEAADGDGYSLVYIAGDPGLASSWRSSSLAGGNPGGSDSISYTGGDLLAYALGANPAIAADFSSGTISYSRVIAADETKVYPQWSDDLVDWETAGMVEVSEVPDGSGGSAVSWTLPAGGARGFLRIRVERR